MVDVGRADSKDEAYPKRSRRNSPTYGRILLRGALPRFFTPPPSADARVYGLWSYEYAMHEIGYISPIEYTLPLSAALTIN